MWEYPDLMSAISHLLCSQVQTWAQQQGQRIQASLAALEEEREEVQRLLDWISSAEEALNLRDQEPLPDTMEQNLELIEQHTVWLFSVLWVTYNMTVLWFTTDRTVHSKYTLSCQQSDDHSCEQVFMEEMNKKLQEVEHATKSCKNKSISKQQVSPSKRPLTSKLPWTKFIFDLQSR